MDAQACACFEPSEVSDDADRQDRQDRLESVHGACAGDFARQDRPLRHSG
jgi:hypothetical protein